MSLLRLWSNLHLIDTRLWLPLQVPLVVCLPLDLLVSPFGLVLIVTEIENNPCLMTFLGLERWPFPIVLDPDNFLLI